MQRLLLGQLEERRPIASDVPDLRRMLRMRLFAAESASASGSRRKTFTASIRRHASLMRVGFSASTASISFAS